VRVARILQETADTRSFVLDVPEDLRDLFAYRPGQFCTFRVTVGDEELLRCYSMSSAPETDADLTVTVKRVPGGRVSGWFHERVMEGDVLHVTKPAGVFCPQVNDRPVVAFAGGSGITPVMSITKSVLASTARSVRLLYANRDREAIIFGNELDDLRGHHADRLSLCYHLDSDAGFLDAQAIDGFVGDDREADFYLCGPAAFMDIVEHRLLALGVEPDRIFIERFVNEGQPGPRAPTEGSLDGDVASVDAEIPDEMTVILKGKRHTVAYRRGDTVLETARRGGLAAPFSCEAGECATCMAFVREGSASMRVNNALDPEEIEEGWVLTCQAVPEGTNLTVEYESL